MYCMKCKKKTESTQVHEKLTSNNRKILSALCQVCESKKSQFIPKVDRNKIGQGLFNNLLSKVENTVGEMHLPTSQGEYIPGGSFNNQNNYSYCGPGTKYVQRNQEGYQGINEVDRMCKLHDEFYTRNTDTTSRNISDDALAHRMHEIANDSRFDSTQRNMALLIYYIMKAKVKFGLGIKSKNLKRGPTNTRK